jgi:FkbM family methyltransferase
MRADLPNLYRSGTDIVDVGGNIGCNALMYSDYGPVHTFEPIFHEVLSENVNRNTLQNPVTVHPYGLSNTAGTQSMFMTQADSDGMVNYGSGTVHGAVGLNAVGTFEFKRLDDVYNGTPSVMKIDVEGHEYQVILGGLETIKRSLPAMYIEIFDFETSPIIPLLADLGYTSVPRPEHNYLFTNKNVPA